jgi:NAD(P)H-dependent FMN reductase
MVQVLLLCGSVRAGSSNEAMLRLAEEVAGDAFTTVFYEGLGGLPHFNPDLDADPLPPEVAALRNAIAESDAVLICTPEYAGTLPGSFKNLLDWTVGGTEICDKPTAWINAANPGRGEGAAATLRTVLQYTGAAIVEDACVRIAIGDSDARERIGAVLAGLRAAASQGTDKR